MYLSLFLKGYFELNNYPQGYAPQQTPPPGYVPQPQGYAPQSSRPMPQQQQKAIQEAKFYKSGFLSSAAGRFQRDSHHMIGKGWHIKSVAFLGINLFLQRVIAVVYEQ
jgi:hypothetical protein